MIQLLKFIFIGAGVIVGLVVFALACLVLMFFPEWVRWTAAGITFVALAWFFLFGRYRRKAGILINDGTSYDRWRTPNRRIKGDFL